MRTLHPATLAKLAERNMTLKPITIVVLINRPDPPE